MADDGFILEQRVDNLAAWHPCCPAGADHLMFADALSHADAHRQSSIWAHDQRIRCQHPAIADAVLWHRLWPGNKGGGSYATPGTFDDV